MTRGSDGRLLIVKHRTCFPRSMHLWSNESSYLQQNPNMTTTSAGPKSLDKSLQFEVWIDDRLSLRILFDDRPTSLLFESSLSVEFATH